MKNLFTVLGVLGFIVGMGGYGAVTTQQYLTGYNSTTAQSACGTYTAN